MVLGAVMGVAQVAAAEKVALAAVVEETGDKEGEAAFPAAMACKGSRGAENHARRRQ